MGFEGGERVSFTDELWEKVPATGAARLKVLDPMEDSRAGGVVRSMEEEERRVRVGV